MTQFLPDGLSPNEFRNKVIVRVRDAIWDSLEEQIDMGYIDRERRIIDTGMADDLDMDKVAEAAMKVVLGSLDPSIDPQWEITAPGSFEIADEQGPSQL